MKETEMAALLYTGLHAQWSGYRGMGPGMMDWGYAQGEIDKEEFEEKKKSLES